MRPFFIHNKNVLNSPEITLHYSLMQYAEKGENITFVHPIQQCPKQV